MEKINTIKKIFYKKDFANTINTQFSELTEKPKNSFFDINLATIDDFFILYEKFFYDIPKEGEKSHTYILDQSGNYVNAEKINEEIKALLDEIDLLREENIKLQTNQINKLTSQTRNPVSR